MSPRDTELRNRVLYRYSAGELHEVECRNDDQEMLKALNAACEARKAAGEPQISVIMVYRVENIATVVILLDAPGYKES